jgi:allophanate hydrolase
LVSFSLGTDTAGSGRVPAAFNNIVGLKPTKGLLSTRGVVPACRSLDCVSIFGLTAEDARAVLAVTRGFDAKDPFSRRARARGLPSIADCRVGVPRRDRLEFFGNRDAERLFGAAVKEFERLGARRVEIDFAPFVETARLLYGGPWVAERYLAIKEFFDRHAEAVFPVTRDIIGGAAKYSASDGFAAQYKLEELRRQAEVVWDEIDVLVTPTAGTIYTIEEVNADPIRLNTNLGYYTNFMNLLDLAAIAVPAGFQKSGLPFGVTLVAPAFSDEGLCALGGVVHRRLVEKMGATGVTLPKADGAEIGPLPGFVKLAVCGAHMSGLPLNHQLTERGGRLVRTCWTAPRYRLYALTEFSPPRPGMVRVESGGVAIEVEVWTLPTENVGSFIDGIPAPLGIGTVELESGALVRGFLCEGYAIVRATEISHLAGWRAYVTRRG